MFAAPVSVQSGSPANYFPVIFENSGANWDHSGIGAFVIYNTTYTCQYTMNLSGSAEVAGQIIFHSIWWSHLEDLQILHFMTGCTFSTRQELANCFRQKGSTAPEITFSPPPVRNYAKLSQTLPTDKTTGGQQQVWNRVTFSSHRKTPIGEIFKPYYKKKSATTAQGSGTANLYSQLSNWRQQLVREVMKDGFINQGVVEWRQATGLRVKIPGEVVTSPTVGASRLFLGMAEPAQQGDMEEDEFS